MTTGRIYIIRSNLTDKVYIGSTTKLISHRFGEHSRKYRYGTQTTTAKLLFDIGECRIELLEEVDFNVRRELNAREDFWISQFPTAVNVAKAQSPTGVDIYCHACGHTIRKTDRARHTAFPKHIKKLFSVLPLEP